MIREKRYIARYIYIVTDLGSDTASISLDCSKSYFAERYQLSLQPILIIAPYNENGGHLVS